MMLMHTLRQFLVPSRLRCCMERSKSRVHGRLSIRSAIIGAGILSGIVNILGLAGPLFMLEVYDRVIPSRSIPTLGALLLLVGGLFGISGLLDALRTRVMVRFAGILDASLSKQVFYVVAGTPLRARITGDVLKPAQEMDQIRGFLSGPGPAALFDLPWMPVYLALCFLVHPLIGWLTAAAMLVLTSLTIINDMLTRSLTKDAAAAVARRNRYGEAAHRSAEAIAAMGMVDRAASKWYEAHVSCTTAQRRAADVAGVLSAISKALRYMLQSGALGLGAYLVIQGDMTGGMIVAGSIIVARALAPIEQIIGNWRSLLAARQSWQRLKDVFELFPVEIERTELPAPQKFVSIENVSTAPPGERRVVVRGVSFEAKAGSVIGIIGPSGSGKSSLVRALVGIWQLVGGQIRLDGASLDQWGHSERGRHIGYMPQGVELFPGTIAENIARLDPEAEDDVLVAAAQAAGVHDLIVQLPDGYQTQVGDGGTNLSAGQRQRIALARALYRDPFLVVLDEPNSNLDADGDKALIRAIDAVRRRGGIVIVVAHRSSILAVLDLVLVLEAGTAKAFGPRDSVLKPTQMQSASSRTQLGPSLKVIDGDGAQS